MVERRVEPLRSQEGQRGCSGGCGLRRATTRLEDLGEHQIRLRAREDQIRSLGRGDRRSSCVLSICRRASHQKHLGAKQRAAHQRVAIGHQVGSLEGGCVRQEFARTILGRERAAQLRVDRDEPPDVADGGRTPRAPRATAAPPPRRSPSPRRGPPSRALAPRRATTDRAVRAPRATLAAADRTRRRPPPPEPPSHVGPPTRSPSVGGRRSIRARSQPRGIRRRGSVRRPSRGPGRRPLAPPPAAAQPRRRCARPASPTRDAPRGPPASIPDTRSRSRPRRAPRRRRAMETLLRRMCLGGRRLDLGLRRRTVDAVREELDLRPERRRFGTGGTRLLHGRPEQCLRLLRSSACSP